MLSDKLPNIEPRLELEIRSGISSIHKLKKDEIYNEFIKKHQNLKGAEYIVYPNDNADRGTVFLDNKGTTIEKVNFYANELVYEPNSFEIEYQKIHSKLLESIEEKYFEKAN